MPLTPDGRFSPADSDDWDLTTDLAAMQVSNMEATNASITNALANFQTAYRVGTNQQRTSLSGSDLFEGLKFYATDTDIRWTYNGTTWVRDVRVATFSLNRPSPPNNTVITDITLTPTVNRTTDSTLYASIGPGRVTLNPGLYIITFAASIGGGAQSRSFMDINVGGENYRGGVQVGEDTGALTVVVNINDTRNVLFQVYKNAPGSAIGGVVTIQKVDY